MPRRRLAQAGRRRADRRTMSATGEAAEITVEGLVQGVGFREFTLRHAADLALGGWVTNLPDGHVRVWAEGPREALATLAERLRRGPRLARVVGLVVAWQVPFGYGAAFTIRDEPRR